MTRALGALVLAMLALSACAPLESMERELFSSEAAGGTQAATSRPSAEPPLPRRKPGAISDQAAAIPDQPAVISDQAAVISDQAVAIPDQPAAIPDQPAAISDQPEAISELTLAEADPERLVGLDFDAAKALLGDPAAKHEKPPAEVWAYEGGACMFNLFFYPSVDDKIFRVLAYEVMKETLPSGETVAGAAEPVAVKVRDKDSPMVRRCFAELLHNQQIPDAG